MLVVGIDIMARGSRYAQASYSRKTHIVTKLHCINTALEVPKLCTLSPKRTMVFDNGTFVYNEDGSYFSMTGVDDSLIPTYNCGKKNKVYVWKKYMSAGAVVGYAVVINGKFLKLQDISALASKGLEPVNVVIGQGYIKELNNVLVEQIHVAQPAQVKPPVKVTQSVQVMQPVKATTPIQATQPVKVTSPIQVPPPVKVTPSVQVTQPAKVIQPAPAMQSEIQQSKSSTQVKSAALQSNSRVMQPQSQPSVKASVPSKAQTAARPQPAQQMWKPRLTNDNDLSYALEEVRTFNDWQEFEDRLLSKAQQRCEPIQDGTYIKIDEDASRIYELTYNGNEEEDYSYYESYMFTVHPIFDGSTPDVLELKVPSVLTADQIEIGRCICMGSAKPVEIKTNISTIADYAFVPSDVRTNPMNEFLTKVTINYTNSLCNVGSWAFYGCINLQNITIFTKNIYFHNYAIAGSGVKEVLVKAYLPKIWNTNIKWGEGTFADCKMLDTIQIDGVLPNIPKMFCYNSDIKQFIFGMINNGKREFAVKATNGQIKDMQTISVDSTAFNSKQIVVPCIINGFKQFNDMFVVQ